LQFKEDMDRRINHERYEARRRRSANAESSMHRRIAQSVAQGDPTAWLDALQEVRSGSSLIALSILNQKRQAQAMAKKASMFPLMSPVRTPVTPSTPRTKGREPISRRVAKPTTPLMPENYRLRCRTAV
jgi:hypothetical protein